jgi:hypothetical protein
MRITRNLKTQYETKCRILNVVASGTYCYYWTFNAYKFRPRSFPNVILSAHAYKDL